MKVIQRLAAVLLLASGSAQAAFTAYMYQDGADVVVSGSGTLVLTGLVFGAAGAAVPRVQPNSGVVIVGATPGVWAYDGIAGPATFGAGGLTFSTSDTGDKVAVAQGLNRLVVPNGYVPGSFLTGRSVWAGTTIAALGATPGTYTWTWPGDSFTLHVGVAPPPPTPTPVPTLSEWAMIMLSMLLAWFAMGKLSRRGAARRPDTRR